MLRGMPFTVSIDDWPNPEIVRLRQIATNLTIRAAAPKKAKYMHGGVTSDRSKILKPEAVTPRLNVGFILTKHFTLCAFANFVDVLRLAADEGDRSRPIMCKWTVLSHDMSPVVSSSGISIQPQERFGDPSRFDYIAVVGGLTDGLAAIPPAYTEFLHKAAAQGVHLIGICTGAFALHHMGLLDGYKCCVSWFHHSDFLNQFDGLNPVANQIYVVDRDRLTCSGGVSSAHLAAFLVDRHVGRAQASKSLHIMIIDDALDSEKAQPTSSLKYITDDEIVRRALLIMRQFIDVPVVIADISTRLGTSKRLLERHFQSALKMSPQEAYLNIRIDHACHMLRETPKTIAQIALECGFCDSSHFSRTFRSRLNMSPNAYRATVRA